MDAGLGVASGERAMADGLSELYRELLNGSYDLWIASF